MVLSIMYWPVAGEPELDQRIEHAIPDALLRPAPETNIDRVPLAVSLVHLPPRTHDDKAALQAWAAVRNASLI
jgi:hypothetical protein